MTVFLRISSVMLLTCAVFALFGALIHAHVLPSWGASWVWIVRLGLTVLVVVLVAAAATAWRRSGGPWFTWVKELTVGIIAAFAVLVSGGVSAFVSWTGTSNTLQEQRKLEFDKYFRDTKKALYFDIVKSATELGGAIDPIPLAAQEVGDGRSSAKLIELQDNLKKKRDAYQYLIQPAFIVSPADTANQAKAVADEASKILTMVIVLNCATTPEWLCKPPGPQPAIRTLAHDLSTYIVKAEWGRIEGSLLVLMRRDLGIPLN